MDAHHLRHILEDAVKRGVVDADSLEGIDDGTSIKSWDVPTRNMRGIYTRRLKHTGNDATLLAQTVRLVEFLESYTGDSLQMVCVYPTASYSRMFLADSEELEILHWMQMANGRL